MNAIRWPAEWEPQERVWFSWPHREDTWPEALEILEQKFATIITLAADVQNVSINACESLHDRIRKKVGTSENIALHHHPTNDVWCRDHGATFVVKKEQLHAINWSFNAWGGKFPPWDLDDAIAKKMALAANATHYRSPLHLEGGAIEGNGNGVVLTTEAVALNPNRNPEWDKLSVENELKATLGAKTVFWLPKGIEGDDTDGHIDDIARFIREDVLIAASETNPASPNYKVLAENKERLQDVKTRTNSTVEILEMPMPEPLYTKKWRLNTLPASYLNFLILNNAILVPTFNQAKNDATALGILRECFSGYKVTGIDCRDLIYEGGAIHCLSQQQPHT